MQKLKVKNSKLKEMIFAFGKNPKLRSTFYELPQYHASGYGAQRSKQGFTLIEMLVAITVLLLSIAGPLTIAAQAVFSANIAKDRLTAAYLAQEGIELMRAKRDANAIQGSDWLSGLDVCLNGDCYIATINFSPNACSGACPPLGFNESVINYGYVGSPPSIFTRTISIEEIISDQEAVVTSVVEWQAGGRTHEVVLIENLFNWR